MIAIDRNLLRLAELLDRREQRQQCAVPMAEFSRIERDPRWLRGALQFTLDDVRRARNPGFQLPDPAEPDRQNAVRRAGEGNLQWLKRCIRSHLSTNL